MVFQFKTLHALLLGAFGASLVFGAAPAYAQSSAERLERVEVTGSNIKRVDTETASPVSVITRKDIEQSGYTTTSQLLQNLPGNNAGGFNEANVNSFAAGAAAVSLRGLGPQATLILLNGRRLTNYGFAVGGQSTFVDLNTIPLDVIERVEILRDGASAIYGSEAIAGVINIILRKDFTGVAITGSGGISAQRDGRELRGSATAGFGDLTTDKFNAFVNVESFRRNPIYQRDRDYFVNSLDRRGIGVLDARSTNSYPGNFYTGTGANGGGAFISPITNTCPANLISNGGPNGIAAGRCLIDADQYIVASPKTKRDNVYTRLNVQITPALQAFAEAGESKTNTTTVSTPTSLLTWLRDNGSGGVVLDRVSNIVLPANYPGNTTGRTATPRYAFGDVGSRVGNIESKLGRFIGGVHGNFGASWDWEVAGGYIRSQTNNEQKGYVSASYFRSLVANRQYVFGNPSANNPAIYDSLSPTITRVGVSTSKYVDGKVSGEVFQLPAGPLAVAAGFEYRKESLNDSPDQRVAIGDIIGLGATSASGSRSATSFYGELSIPILSILESQIAVRHDHFSDFGNSTTPKVGFKLTPIKQIAFRGTYSEGFRAPSLPEVSKSVLTGFYNGVTDPVRCFTTQALDCNISVPAQIGANPNLVPEKSKSYTLGTVIEPMKDLTTAIDYYWIRRKNEIVALDLETLLNNEAAYPGYVVRGPRDPANPTLPGAIQYVNLRYQNLGTTVVRGIDLDVTHRLDLGSAGKLTTAFDATYVISYDVETTPGSGFVKYNSSHNQPRIRGNLSFSDEVGPFRGQVKFNYIGSFDYRGSPQNDCALLASYPQGCRIGS